MDVLTSFGTIFLQQKDLGCQHTTGRRGKGRVERKDKQKQRQEGSTWTSCSQQIASSCVATEASITLLSIDTQLFVSTAVRNASPLARLGAGAVCSTIFLGRTHDHGSRRAFRVPLSFWIQGYYCCLLWNVILFTCRSLSHSKLVFSIVCVVEARDKQQWIPTPSICASWKAFVGTRTARLQTLHASILT